MSLRQVEQGFSSFFAKILAKNEDALNSIHHGTTKTQTYFLRYMIHHYSTEKYFEQFVFLFSS